MSSNSLRRIKHAQRESYFYREIVALLQQIAADDAALQDLIVTRVALSHNRGSCTVFLALINSTSEELFNEKLRQLVLYKPSIRSSLAKSSHARSVPELHFKYDDRLKKVQRIEQLLHELKESGEL